MVIALFTLGGTIAMAGPATDDGQVRLRGADLAAAVPSLGECGLEVEVHDVAAVPSASLTFVEIVELVEAAAAAVERGASGVVITQGTDTLEETAYLIDLLWPHAEPIVLTGAMRNPTLPGHDGPANLLAGALAAASGDLRDLGALVAFNDEVHAARWVRKQHSTSTAAFASPNAGPIGVVVEGQVRILTRPRRRRPLPRPERARLEATTVALHTVTLDDDGALLERIPTTHRGLVVAGFGAGHVPAGLALLLEALAERIPVVLTSRTGAGSVLRHTYGAVGSEVDLQRRGLVNGGMLDPYKARVLLRLLLATDVPRGSIAEMFDSHQ